MHDVNLVIVFNHHHSASLPLVKHYSSRFTENVQIAAPFDGPGIIRYSSGSYLWQGAIVQYLQNLDETEGYTLFIHDDLVMNSCLDLSDLQTDENDFIRFFQSFKLEGVLDLNKWIWQFRTLTNWFTPKTSLFGSGTNDVVSVMKNSLLYKMNQTWIDSLDSSKLSLSANHPQHNLVTSWIDNYFPGKEEFDFGLPLYIGVSDFFMFPNSYASLIEDFLRCSLECGLFVEIAIPTLVEWLHIPVYYEHKRQLFRSTEGPTMFHHLKSIEEIEEYFGENPGLLSIHPVKFSELFELAKESDYE